MTEWGMIAMTAALAGYALFVLRRRARFGGLAVGLIALVSVSALGVTSSHAALLAMDLDGSSPDTLVLPIGGNHTITVTNRSGSTVTVTGVTVVGGTRYNVLPIPDPNSCGVVPVLAPNAACTVFVIDAIP